MSVGDPLQRLIGHPGLWRQTLSASACGYVGLALILFFSFFYGLGAHGLLNNNEGLYAEIAREMLETHSYIIPTVNYVPYIEKPPLLYWLIALSYSVFGISEFSARLVPAFTATLLCLGLVHVARGMRRARAGLLGALILGSSFGLILCARTIVFDVLLTGFLALALLSFYLWHETGRVRHLRVAYACLGLAVMAKGVVALALAGPTILIFLLINKAHWRTASSLLDVPGIALFLFIAVPWHIAATIAEPGFGWFYFVNEHLLRFLGWRTPNDFYTGPIYYYIPRVLLGFLPWSAWLVVAFQAKGRRGPLEQFLLIWAGVFFIFFSLSRAKANYYLITALPALALYIGLQIERCAAQVNRRLALIGASLAALVIVATFVSLRSSEIHIAPLPWVTVVLTTALIAIALISVLESHSVSPFALTITLAAFAVPFVLLVNNGASAGEKYLSGVDVARTIERQDPSRPVFLYRDFEELSSIVFYLQRPVPVIDTNSGDLHYGKSAAVGAPFVSSADLQKSYASRPLYVVLRANRLAEFERSLPSLTHCSIYHDGGLVLLTSDRGECRMTEFVAGRPSNQTLRSSIGTPGT